MLQPPGSLLATAGRGALLAAALLEAEANTEAIPARSFHLTWWWRTFRVPSKRGQSTDRPGNAGLKSVMAATYASIQKRGHAPTPGAACDPTEAELEGAVYSTVKPRALRGASGTLTEYTAVASESPACSSPGSGRPLLSLVVAPSTARKASTPSRNCPGPEAYEDVTDTAVPGLGPSGLQPSSSLDIT
ncbi:uncharacterized protein LOC122734054 isoform X2 [Dromiciops gliroides]|uniref:uncharacterized protein LOC122734054 isoform X2 n=1 Tax=Dromiciops gliroides TaxID=33562 RepID=UPI001CC36718|nr:uncharacterized protein LOC122734054 isoform X2 [Dromiciops gliroides]